MCVSHLGSLTTPTGFEKNLIYPITEKPPMGLMLRSKGGFHYNFQVES